MIQCHRYENGLVLLVEPITGVASAAMTLLLPAGAVAEPDGKRGVGAVASEMIFRGAGELDAHAHSDALDVLGVHRSADVQTQHMRLSAVFLRDRLDPALPLLLDMIRRPHLSDKDFAPSVQLAMQAIEALEDEPQEKVMLELKRHHLGEPMGRSTLGQLDHLRRLTPADLRAYCQSSFVPGGSILAFAGAVDFQHVRDRVGRLLEDWQGAGDLLNADTRPMPSHGYHHLEATTTQQHIGLAFETIGEADKTSILQRVAIGVLSGGMSGRLFTEVREVRGLCYSVYATYAARRASGTVYAYAGTTTERAAQTLEVLSGELVRLSDGVTEDEFHRAVVGLKARLVMQGESTSARASAIAHDQFLLGRPRTLAQRAAEVDAVTLAQLNDFVAAHRPVDFTTLTIGPQPLVLVD